jgi:hypothetical protein
MARKVMSVTAKLPGVRPKAMSALGDGRVGLLAKALEDNEMGRARTPFDTRGCEQTPCRREGVGWVLNRGIWEPTDRFLLVTRCKWIEGRWVHEVVNAYPISENW